MCGIFGYIGKENAGQILINGLKNLEYRGYDSAGIVVCAGRKQVVSVKKKGMIDVLARAFQPLDFPEASSGICHSRWATHGGVTDMNAHPHTDCKQNVYIVHNGIIENYKEIKDQLIKEGHWFSSETDTEVIAHLFEKLHTGDARETLYKILKIIKGAYAIVGMTRDNPREIFFARLSSPLIIGKKKGEAFIASDVHAFVGHTKKVVYLNDYDYGVISPDKINIFNLEKNGVVDHTAKKLSWDVELSSKGDHAHYMLKEMFEIPLALQNAMRGRVMQAESRVRLGGLDQAVERIRTINKIVLCACGTAYYAGLLAKNFFEETLNVPVFCEVASELRYKKFPYDTNTAFIAVSQSGETIDTLQALTYAKSCGALTLGVVNVVGSTIARSTDAGVYLHIGPEIAVASTKAFHAQVMVLYLMGISFAQIQGIHMPHKKELLDAMALLPQKVSEILNSIPAIKKLARGLKNAQHVFYLGRKYSFPMALEGALKLKEIAYIFAEAYAGGELKHGSIALIDKSVLSIILAPHDPVFEKTISNAMEIKARGGKILAIVNKKTVHVNEISKNAFELPGTLEPLNAITYGSFLQLLAYYVALAKKLPIDKPRNLAKSVTVE